MADAPAAAPPNLDAVASSSSRNPPTPDPGRCSPFGPIARHAARRAPAALPPPAPCPHPFGLIHTFPQGCRAGPTLWPVLRGAQPRMDNQHSGKQGGGGSHSASPPLAVCLPVHRQWQISAKE